ncbi:MAG: N-acetylmuramoyl-L-alanine amidase [Lachnospiraceae bacterium]
MDERERLPERSVQLREKQAREERVRRKRRRRRKKKMLRALILTLLIVVGICLLVLLFRLGRLLLSAAKTGELELPWNQAEAVILLDAGHGGRDQGASYGEVLEKELTLEITKKTKELLQKAGYRVSMTRTGDTFINKYDRADYANREEPDIFVSIHCNFLEKGQADGIETFYAESKGTDSLMLAQEIQCNITEKTRAGDRGAKTADYVVVKDTKMPAALVEVGFLSDAHERELLQQEEYQEKLAEGIAAGIQAYWEEQKQETGMEPEPMEMWNRAVSD